VAYQRIQTYANFVGISIEVAASDAITEWMSSTGELVVEALQKKRRESAAKQRLAIVSSAGSLTSTNSIGNSQVDRMNSSEDRVRLRSAVSARSSFIAADLNGDDKS
jgi:hypothetical protein